MSEEQFGEMLKSPITYSGPYLSHNQDSTYRNLLAVETLIQNRRVWFAHWKSQMQTNLFMIDFWCQESQQIKRKRFTRLVTGFLFYVEMINTIVPASRGVGFHLAEALALIGDGNTDKTDANIEHRKMITKINQQLRAGRVNDLTAALWTLLEFWMFKSRWTLYQKISTVDPRGLLRTKVFFNLIFTQSIANLSRRIGGE